jgi:hypothetical protein
LAVASLVLGIAGTIASIVTFLSILLGNNILPIMLFTLLEGIMAIVLGAVAKHSSRDNTQLGDRGIAKAGLWLGVAALVLLAFTVAVVMVAVAILFPS